MTREQSADSLAILIQDFSSEFSLELKNSILHSTKQRFCQTLFLKEMQDRVLYS